MRELLEGEPGRLKARMQQLGALAAAVRSGSAHREDRRFGLGGPADKINAACALLDPCWLGGSNELMAIAVLDEACEMLDARASASSAARDGEQAAVAGAVRDALWEEYEPRDVTGRVIRPHDDVRVTRPDGTVTGLTSPEEARALPPGAMWIAGRPAPAGHPADLYPGLVPHHLRDSEGGRDAAVRYLALAIRHGRYLPFGKTAATATPWDVEKAEAEAAQHTAFLASERARARNAPQRRADEARVQYERETCGGYDPHIPPILVRDGDAAADGSFPAVDNNGREYLVRLEDAAGGGMITVTYAGESASAPAGPSPTRTARELAGVLACDWVPADGPYAGRAREARRIADELYALDPSRGPSRTDYSGAAPALLVAARLFDGGQPKEGRAALRRAIRELNAWVKDDFYRNHVCGKSRLTAGDAARYAEEIRTLSQEA